LLAVFVREPRELLFASMAKTSRVLVITMLVLEVPIVRLPPVQTMPVVHEFVIVVLLDTEGQVAADEVLATKNNKLKTKRIFLIMGLILKKGAKLLSKEKIACPTFFYKMILRVKNII
jgi:hypothetical protein